MTAILKNNFVNIKISPTNVFELTIQKNFLLRNEVSWANLNPYKRTLNWQPLGSIVFIISIITIVIIIVVIIYH